MSMMLTVGWKPGIFHEEGLHAFIPGHPASKEKLDEMSKKYQDKIRNSPLWKELLATYGSEKAEEILKECWIEIRK